MAGGEGGGVFCRLTAEPRGQFLAPQELHLLLRVRRVEGRNWRVMGDLQLTGKI